ncbi:MAG: helix-turn-helix domain-containing protein [Gemmatimonadales bacterium]
MLHTADEEAAGEAQASVVWFDLPACLMFDLESGAVSKWTTTATNDQSRGMLVRVMQQLALISAGGEWTSPEPIKPQTAIAKLGRAVLRLRLYWHWSQKDLEIRSGVDQTTISRLERGTQRGLSIRRLARILDALRVGEVTFDKPPTIPQTALEVMLYGDHWANAGAEADRRLQWTGTPRDDQSEPAAVFGDAG